MIIETPRLRLRPYAGTDLRDAFAVLGDAETMSFYPRPYSEDEVAAIIRSAIDSYRQHGYGRFAVIETASGDFVGDCGITLQDIDGAQEHEVGYRIGKAKWGRGYAHESSSRRAVRL
jgi:[ribosomal protein S5]-alanine N-acetyltransferase